MRVLLSMVFALLPAIAFGAISLLSHGIAKVVLVIALLREQLWAYPWMIGLLGVFIAYQLYRLTYRVTIGLTLLTLFDAFVVWLTIREYRLERRFKYLFKRRIER